MIDKLTQQFGDAIVMSSTPKQDPAVAWYVTEQQESIGFIKSKLTEKELGLIDLFLTPMSFDKYHMSPLEEEWTEFLYGDASSSIPTHPDFPFRFIHFKALDVITDRESFHDALDSLHTFETVIVWEDATQGVIIEKNKEDEEEPIDYQELCAALISDFYLNLTLFIGTKKTDIETLRTSFEWEKQCFALARKHQQKQTVFYNYDALPYVLFNDIPKDKLKQFSEHILRPVIEEKELLQSIHTYITCNLNTSLAAKQMFMHRNSLQYRVDKFIEKTGYDIKNFQEATIVYFALLIHYSQ
ncbi:PucR family transcriptional regulator [Bacillus alkalicellulosilyticus]|uniref:PucR family transcriptional regulator n=1 Tax=Alkalihalobacterium alkalicellulosilyticum TaxID=1912214 RepID=UPI00099688E2|nr:helix-turn-helix domain-containing protein [Bacillus alkalicellulosilyticus]